LKASVSAPAPLSATELILAPSGVATKKLLP
jgi:hypothetical protein